jgi:hypothetical protein
MAEGWQELRIVLFGLTGFGILLSSVVILTEVLVLFGLVSKKDDKDL